MSQVDMRALQSTQSLPEEPQRPSMKPAWQTPLLSQQPEHVAGPQGGGSGGRHCWFWQVVFVAL